MLSHLAVPSRPAVLPDPLSVPWPVTPQPQQVRKLSTPNCQFPSRSPTYQSPTHLLSPVHPIIHRLDGTEDAHPGSDQQRRDGRGKAGRNDTRIHRASAPTSEDGHHHCSKEQRKEHAQPQLQIEDQLQQQGALDLEAERVQGLMRDVAARIIQAYWRDWKAWRAKVG